MSIFECSICLDSVQDPVVTLCGHLFCRPCLDKWLQFHSHRLECPVCKAPVDEDKLVPIYGKGSDLPPDIPSQQPQTAPAPPELPPELTYVRQDRSCGLFCKRLFGALSSVWNILFGAISSIWNNLVVAMSSIWDLLFSAISSIWNILVIVMSSTWNLLVSVISSIWNALVIVMSSVWNLLLDVIRFVWYTLAYTEWFRIPPHAQRNPLAYLTICFIGFFLLYKRVSSWLS